MIKDIEESLLRKLLSSNSSKVFYAKIFKISIIILIFQQYWCNGLYTLQVWRSLCRPSANPPKSAQADVLPRGVATWAQLSTWGSMQSPQLCQHSRACLGQNTRCPKSTAAKCLWSCLSLSFRPRRAPCPHVKADGLLRVGVHEQGCGAKLLCYWFSGYCQSSGLCCLCSIIWKA